MIFTLLINGAALFFTGVLNHLPDSVGLPSGINNAIFYVGNALNQVSYIIPVQQLFLALGTVVLFESSIWLFNGLVWIYKRLPFIGR